MDSLGLAGSSTQQLWCLTKDKKTVQLLIRAKGSLDLGNWAGANTAPPGRKDKSHSGILHFFSSASTDMQGYVMNRI